MIYCKNVVNTFLFKILNNRKNVKEKSAYILIVKHYWKVKIRNYKFKLKLKLKTV